MNPAEVPMSGAMIAAIIVSCVSGVISILLGLVVSLIAWVFTTERTEMRKTLETDRAETRKALEWHRDQLARVWSEQQEHAKYIAAHTEHRKAADKGADETREEIVKLDGKVEEIKTDVTRLHSKIDVISASVSRPGMHAVKPASIPRSDG